jgi:hypothetical protein
MRAAVGDRLVVKGHKVGEHDVDGEILEVRGKDGGPPFLVRWNDGHEGLVFPGADAMVEHFATDHPNVIGQVEHEVAQRRAQLEDLRVQLALAEMEARQRVEPMLDGAERALDALGAIVAELRLTGRESWEAVRTDVDDAVRQVKAAAAAVVAALQPCEEAALRDERDE